MDERYTETCCNCGIEFCMSKEHNDMLRMTKRTFYCPSGHPQSYIGETFEQRLENLKTSIREKNETITRLQKIISESDARISRLRRQIRHLIYSRGYYRGTLAILKKRFG